MTDFETQPSYSWPIKCLYLLLQSISILLCVLTFFALYFPHTRNAQLYLIMPSLTIFYFIFRNINYKICRLCGYHASPKLVDYFSEGPEGGVTLPTFEKISEDYRQIYQARHIGFQSLFYCLFMLLNAGLVLIDTYVIQLDLYSDTAISVYIRGLIIALALIFIVFIHIKINKWYQKYFAKWFDLKVILVEHGQPIFAKKKEADSSIWQ
ncbi:hypothetical protein [Streptococcus macacae]|uniref:Uncharacterized protein n=1 Tax=Streptococcus macacae NCTC 11558 TaxID=764298 RepID=G5JU11_9STRE|nr:hypothetical protein [Streptococcus macacae]EHJ51702.1 hypothetical protein STRMA_0551 [Streptococcus macacae NCTC 11558]SUN78378.1 putative lipoprotein [Streptococcus macacae NCTC 11558]